MLVKSTTDEHLLNDRSSVVKIQSQDELTMHYYQHNIKSFNNATRHLTRVERSLYRDLIELYYDTEEPLTSDIDRLQRLVIANSDEEKNALSYVLSEFFVLQDNYYRHEYCDLEIERYRKQLSAKSSAGKASAEKRKAKSSTVQQVNNSRSTVDQQPLISNESVTGSKAVVNSQVELIPATANLVDTTNNKKTKRQSAAKPESLEEVTSYMIEQGATSRDAEAFYDYYSSNGWVIGKARTPMKDWKAAVRTWLRNNYGATGSTLPRQANTYDANGNIVAMKPVNQPTSKQGQAIAALQAMKSTNRGVM